jgi:hypothetical protein
VPRRSGRVEQARSRVAAIARRLAQAQEELREILAELSEATPLAVVIGCVLKDSLAPAIEALDRESRSKSGVAG